MQKRRTQRNTSATSYVSSLPHPCPKKSLSLTTLPNPQNCPSNSTKKTGWCGIAHGGKMVKDLLLVAWPHEDEVLTSFRWATDYAMPAVYPGKSTLTQIASSVNETNYELVYRCEDCFKWSDGEDEEGGIDTSEGSVWLGYAQGREAPENAACPDEIELTFHQVGHNTWVADVEDLVEEGYEDAAKLAKNVVKGDC